MKEEIINQKEINSFISITNPEGTHRIWIPRPTPSGRIYAACNFTLAGNMDFVDAVDKLDYVSVDAANTYDNDYSALTLSCVQDPKGCMEKLINDIPDIMEKYL